MNRIFHVLFALPFACCAIGAVAQSPPMQFGPLRFGMTYDEARSAIPAAEWRIGRKSEYTDRVFAITAAGAVQLAGMSFDVRIGHPYHSGQWFALEREQPVADAMSCEAQALQLATQLEPQVGRFDGPTPEMSRDTSMPPITWTTRRMPNGGVIVTPMPGAASPPTALEDLVKIGANSTVTVGGVDDKGRAVRRKAIK